MKRRKKRNADHSRTHRRETDGRGCSLEHPAAAATAAATAACYTPGAGPSVRGAKVDVAAPVDKEAHALGALVSSEPSSEQAAALSSSGE